jgi:hypothetical protein
MGYGLAHGSQCNKLWKKLTSNALLGANELIGAIGAPLGDYFLGNIHGIFSKNSSKRKSFKNILYYVKNLP